MTRYRRILALAVALLLLLVLAACGEAREKLTPNAEYTITVDYDHDTKTAACSQTVLFRNNTGQSLERLLFHLYPNAFADRSTAPFTKYEWNDAYPNGFSPGGIDISSVTADGAKVNYEMLNGGMILCVNLWEIPAGRTIEIDMEYTLKLPDSPGRFGYGGLSVNFGNAFPILCMFTEAGWDDSPYYAIGDPFFSDVADYNVTVTVPECMTVAATGNIKDKKTSGGRRIYSIEAKLVRDFAFVASDKYKEYHGNSRGVNVIAYAANDEAGKKALSYACEAIKAYCGLFGNYPYKTFSVAEADFFIGGMEYPMLVFINTGFYKPASYGLLEYVIAHETAHQWWYAAVGSNQTEEPWLDESLTEYSTQLYFEKTYGPDVAEAVYEDFVLNKYERMIYSGMVGKNYNSMRPVYEYSNLYAYDTLVYAKGAMAVSALRGLMGDKAFFAALREYYDTYIYKNAKGKDFLAIIQKNSETAAEDFQRFMREDWDRSQDTGEEAEGAA